MKLRSKSSENSKDSDGSHITLCMLGNCSFFLSSADIFFKIIFLKTFDQENYKCQTAWAQIRPDVVSGLICIQTVCKVYQQILFLSFDSLLPIDNLSVIKGQVFLG